MTIESVVRAIAKAKTLDARVSFIRRLPEEFGTTDLVQVYAKIARDLYSPALDPDFAYIHWPPDYEIERVQRAYKDAFEATRGFSKVDVTSLSQAILARPASMLAFRLILGLTPSEFAESTALVGVDEKEKPVSKSKIERLESGKIATSEVAEKCAETIDRMMRGLIFNAPPSGMRRRLEKPDTKKGWELVRKFARSGVPYDVFLHQRLYGGAFNQLLNATGKNRGDDLEDAVGAILDGHGIRYLRTGTGNQAQIRKQFEISVQPAPDFIIHDREKNLRAMLECKATNDGGTARDKASRFASLRNESQRLGGVPVFAVLAGLGWRRVRDALGPVIRDTDGRVFTRSTLSHLVDVQPLSSLVTKPK